MPSDPNHPFHDADGIPRITITPHNGLVTVRHGETEVAKTDRALRLAETGYPDCLYIPMTDVAKGHLKTTDRQTRCPYKGIASYFNIVGTNAPDAENAVWIYPEPLIEVAEIAGHVAFYADRVTIEQG